MATNNKVLKNQVYKHYKGDLYLVEDIALHTEAEEDLVIYRALYGECKLFARPLSMFTQKLSTEDAKKYGQEHRFELQNIQTKNNKWKK